MALRANAVLTLRDFVGVDNQLTQLHFTCDDPGAGERSDYYVVIPDTLIVGLTLAQLRTLATMRLQNKYRTSAVAAVLTPLIGGTITI